MSRTTSDLSKPSGQEPIPATTEAYIRTRNRMHAFTLVQKEFQKSGISQADLAARMRKGTDRVCRLLGAPGNWTLDTVADLLFAISGAEVNYGLSYPFNKPKRNLRQPAWLDEPLQLGPNEMVAITDTSGSTSSTSYSFRVVERA